MHREHRISWTCGCGEGRIWDIVLRRPRVRADGWVNGWAGGQMGGGMRISGSSQSVPSTRENKVGSGQGVGHRSCQVTTYSFFVSPVFFLVSPTVLIRFWHWRHAARSHLSYSLLGARSTARLWRDTHMSHFMAMWLRNPENMKKKFHEDVESCHCDIMHSQNSFDRKHVRSWKAWFCAPRHHWILKLQITKSYFIYKNRKLNSTQKNKNTKKLKP